MNLELKVLVYNIKHELKLAARKLDVREPSCK